MDNKHETKSLFEDLSKPTVYGVITPTMLGISKVEEPKSIKDILIIYDSKNRNLKNSTLFTTTAKSMQDMIVDCGNARHRNESIDIEFLDGTIIKFR